MATFKGENTSGAKFTNEEVKELRKIFWEGDFSIREFAKIYEMTDRGMGEIINNTCYIDNTYIISDDMKASQKEKVSRRLSESFKKQNHIPIRIIDQNGKIYKSIYEAAKLNNTSKHIVNTILKKQYKTTPKINFFYLTEDPEDPT